MSVSVVVLLALLSRDCADRFTELTETRSKLCVCVWGGGGREVHNLISFQVGSVTRVLIVQIQRFYDFMKAPIQMDAKISNLERAIISIFRKIPVFCQKQAQK